MAKKKNLKDGFYGEDFFFKKCEELGITPSKRHNKNVIINPGAKTLPSILENFQRYKNKRPASLDQISDLTRCSGLLESYPEIIDYIKKRKLGGDVKHNKNSGYIGIHGSDNNYNTSGEIQLTTPFAFQVKKVADEVYTDIRLLTAYLDDTPFDELSKEQKEYFKAKEQEYFRKADIEKELFQMLRDVTNIDEYRPEIENLFKHYGFDSCTKSLTNHGAALLSEVHAFNKKGEIANPAKIGNSLKMMNTHISMAQKKLCENAVAPLRGGKIIDIKNLSNNL